MSILEDSEMDYDQDFRPDVIPHEPAHAFNPLWGHTTDGIGQVTQHGLHQQRTDKYKELQPFVGPSFVGSEYNDFSRPEVQRIVNRWGGWREESHQARTIKIREWAKDARDKGNFELAEYWERILAKW